MPSSISLSIASSISEFNIIELKHQNALLNLVIKFEWKKVKCNLGVFIWLQHVK